MIWGNPKSKGGIVIRKPFQLLMCILFSIVILAACAKPTEIVTLPPPTTTQLQATKTLPPPTDTPTSPTKTLEPSSTASSIDAIPMIERVSVSNDGTQGNADAIAPSISADGRFVAFSSEADNLVEGDTNEEADIFVHDRKTGETSRVSVSSDGMQGNDRSGPGPSISADGHYVAFKSLADNLVAGDTNGFQDIFVHDRVTGETTRVSVASDGTQADNSSAFTALMCKYSGLSISADGRYVTFNSAANNLVEGDTNEGSGIFVHDRVTGETTRIPVDNCSLPPGTDMSFSPSISADGRYVAFESWCQYDVFLHDRVTGETIRVSVTNDGEYGNSRSAWPSISADGRYVVFISEADNLVEGDTNGAQDIFVYDRVTRKTIRISVSSDGTEGNIGIAPGPSISADGRYVVFTSWPSNVVDSNYNGVADIFVHDMKTGLTQLVSIARVGAQGCGYSYMSSMSPDGRYLAFASNATNLVEGDTNGFTDIFVIDLWASK
jgi:Tol biopolymer transport system component